MKIGIDGRCLQKGKNTGVEEYARGLILHLIKSNPQDDLILFINAFGKIGEDFSWLKGCQNCQIKHYKIPNKLLNFSFWFLNWPKIDKLLGGLDFFISPNLHFTALREECKRILTFHDLSFERMPETFSWRRRLWHFIINPRKSAKEAHQIWAVSDSTSQDLASLYQIDSKKIKVTHPFFNFENFNSKDNLDLTVSRRYNLPHKFILFLGTIEPRKNIKGLIEGFEFFKERNAWARDYKLVIAGEKGWLWESIVERAEKSVVASDIALTDFIEEKDKPTLYALSKVFVYPSFFEGFGFPPLEAMATGTPTIASNCSSMPEILGDGALLIDPQNSFEICLGLEQLLKDEKVYQEYSKKGIKQAKKIAEMERDFNIK